MKFQEPDLRGLSLEELRNRNRAGMAEQATCSDARSAQRTVSASKVEEPALMRC